MLEMFKTRRDALKEKMKIAKGLQKGFTLVEMLVVVIIILILMGIAVAAFSFFGQVDGTELVAESKKVETAVVQVALNDDNREIPAVGITGDAVGANGVITRKGIGGTITVNPTLVALPITSFDSSKDAGFVLGKVAAANGLTEANLRALLRPVNKTKVQKSVAGKADAANYFVVVRKSQLYDTGVAAIDTAFATYNDELANQVFSKKTIIDNDGFHYNGTFKYKK